MAGGGQKVDAVSSSPGVGPIVHGLVEGLEDIGEKGVCPVIVIAVFRGVAAEELQELLIPFKVMIEAVHHLGHGDSAGVKNIVLQGCHGVGDASQPHPLNIGGVVPGSPLVVVPAVLDAVPGDQGEQGDGHEPAVYPFDDVVAPDLDVCKMEQLGFVGLEKIVKGFKGFRLSCFRTQLSACPGIFAVVQGELQDFRQVEVSREKIGLLAEHPGLNTAAGTSLPRVPGAFALGCELLDDGVGVEDGGLTKTCGRDLQGPPDETVGIFPAHLDHGAGLE